MEFNETGIRHAVLCWHGKRIFAYPRLSAMLRSCARSMLASLLLSLLFWACPQAAPLDAAASQVTATFRQLGVPVTGRFRQVQGEVQFDPAKPAGAKATIEIAVQSFDLGDKDYNAEVAKKDWFDAARHPRAQFALKQVQGSGTQLKAEGVLAIKGRSMPVQFPVAIKTVAGKTRIEGRLPVSRLAFSIGEGEWKDTGLVADEVVIEFSLVVPPADGAAATTPPAQTQQQSRSKDNSKESNK